MCLHVVRVCVYVYVCLCVRTRARAHACRLLATYGALTAGLANSGAVSEPGLICCKSGVSAIHTTCPSLPPSPFRQTHCLGMPLSAARASPARSCARSIK